MMVAKSKTNGRQIRSEPPTYASIQEDSAEDSDASSFEGEAPKFVATRHDSEPAPPRPAGTKKEDLLSRTKSAVSLPVSTSTSLSDDTSLYDKAVTMLANDPMYQKEVALGKRIGLYRLGKELGAGNFSKVKLGIHVLTKEKVAVKIMEKTKMDQKAQRLLAREIQSMERTHHPHIIRLFECVETLTRVHLVVEYAGGGELYAFVHEKGKLTEEEGKILFSQVVSAISHLHNRGIVHRDIKAENIMFSAPGVVKLVDFGFSCLLPSANEQLTTFCGSPPYAAPELFRDQSYSGTAVDMWALGVLLYFMLVGITPFKGETLNDLKATIMTGVFSVPDYVSLAASNLIKSMLNTETERRAAIHEVRRNLWLTGSKFKSSTISIAVDLENLDGEKRKIADKVWRILAGYGISEQMVLEANERGPRNSITGTYRIVQYQVHSDLKKVNSNGDLQNGINASSSSPSQASKTNSQMNRALRHRSKTCAIL